MTGVHLPSSQKNEPQRFANVVFQIENHKSLWVNAFGYWLELTHTEKSADPD